jgi:hypothetical protein
LLQIAAWQVIHLRPLSEGLGASVFPSIMALAWSAAPLWHDAQLCSRPACLLLCLKALEADS